MPLRVLFSDISSSVETSLGSLIRSGLLTVAVVVDYSRWNPTMGSDDNSQGSNETGTDSSDRPRGVLSTADRLFLLDRKDLAEQSQRDARYRIRERIQNAILDFEIIDSRLSEDDRKILFGNLQEDYGRYLGDVIRFFYSGLHMHPSIDDVPEYFAGLLGGAITDTYRHQNPDEIVDVSVEIDVDHHSPDIDVLMKKYEDDDASFREMTFLERQGLVTSTDVIKSLIRSSAQSGEGLTFDFSEFSHEIEVGEDGVLELDNEDLRNLVGQPEFEEWGDESEE